MVKINNAETLSLDKSKQRKVAKATHKLKKKIVSGLVSIKEKRKGQKVTAEQKRGLLYISHLPHGFYETELKAYFQQFGRVTNVKVCRSNRTGNSKGFGYVEFSHPEVAKIAAETMNNYLMFKKRVTAEYVPYEKRPKSLFLGKSSNPDRYSSKVRREKQYQKNINLDDTAHSKRTVSRVSKLNKKLQRLQSLGIKTTFKPIDLTVIKQESSAGITIPDSAPSLPNNYEALDSDIEVKLPLKKSRRSLRSLTNKTTSPNWSSLSTTVSKNRMVLAKSLDSVKAVLSSKTNKNLDTENTPSKQTLLVPDSPVKAEKKPRKKPISNLKSISKKTKKAASMNADTVRKIARELIRKKGDSLLNYQPPKTNQTTKKKSRK
ncbi:unnamed protein product [Phaedon cochleariae]|uniref:RRM domain-containing protein n=1 Tax=Phaedon cochleariae TaxID=80249 RepID=A0A9P0GRT7_PHACE|nr:unnamed protein product [Phaedon cochleariae]